MLHCYSLWAYGNRKALKIHHITTPNQDNSVKIAKFYLSMQLCVIIVITSLYPEWAIDKLIVKQIYLSQFSIQNELKFHNIKRLNVGLNLDCANDLVY